MKEKDVNVSQKEDNATVFSERNWNNNYNYVRNYSNYSNFFLKANTLLCPRKICTNMSPRPSPAPTGVGSWLTPLGWV